MVLLAACGGAPRRGPDAPLAEDSPQQTMRTMAAVPWRAIYERGKSLIDAGDATRAEQYLAAALRRGGTTSLVMPQLLRACVAGQRYRAAVDYARPVLEQHPDAWALRYFVATIHLGLGEPQTARGHLELVVQANPAHAEAQFLLGSILREQLNDPAAAEEHFQRYLALEPQGVHADAARAGLMRHLRP